jgi:capsid protein
MDGPKDVQWSPPKFAWVDPLKDITADLLAVRAGIRSMPEVISEQGRDPEAVLAEIVAWNAKLDAAGVVLDSDPRSTAKNGSLQVVIHAGGEEAAGTTSTDKGASP